MRFFLSISIMFFLLLTGCAGNKVPASKFSRIDKKVGNFTKHLKESLFKATDNGLFSIEVLLFEGNLKLGRNDFDIVIHDISDNDVEDADIKILARMPENGIKVKPGMQYYRSGLYSVSKLELTMPGHWELLITVKKDHSQDRVVFDFPNIQ